MELKDEQMNVSMEKEKDGFGVWEAVMLLFF